MVGRVRALDELGLSDEWTPSFIPLGFVYGPRGDQMAPYYPIGFPIHLAAASLLGGWSQAPFWIPTIAGVMCIFVFYLLAREFSLPPIWSLAGALILAIWPVFLAEATQPLSDGVATLWSSMTVLFALRARKKPGWACAAGAAFGMAVLVRPTNVLLVLPLIFALPLKVGTVGLFLAGGLPFGCVFAWYGRLCYGHILRTGYGDFSASFAFNYFPSRLRYYLLWISKTLSPVPLVAWLGLPFERKTPRRDRALLLVWFGVFLAFYCFYVVYNDSLWSVRFVEPGFPAVILGALLVARHVVQAAPHRGERRSPWRLAVASLLFLIVIVTAMRTSSQMGILRLAEGEMAYPRACRWLTSHLPEKSVVVSMAASGALEYYSTIAYARYDWISADQFKSLRPHAERRGYRWFALIFPWEAEDLQKHLPGRWRKLADIQSISAWELAPR